MPAAAGSLLFPPCAATAGDGWAGAVGAKDVVVGVVCQEGRERARLDGAPALVGVEATVLPVGLFLLLVDGRHGARDVLAVSPGAGFATEEGEGRPPGEAEGRKVYVEKHKREDDRGEPGAGGDVEGEQRDVEFVVHGEEGLHRHRRAGGGIGRRGDRLVSFAQPSSFLSSNGPEERWGAYGRGDRPRGGGLKVNSRGPGWLVDSEQEIVVGFEGMGPRNRTKHGGVDSQREQARYPRGCCLGGVVSGSGRSAMRCDAQLSELMEREEKKESHNPSKKRVVFAKKKLASPCHHERL